MRDRCVVLAGIGLLLMVCGGCTADAADSPDGSAGIATSTVHGEVTAGESSGEWACVIREFSEPALDQAGHATADEALEAHVQGIRRSLETRGPDEAARRRGMAAIEAARTGTLAGPLSEADRQVAQRVAIHELRSDLDAAAKAETVGRAELTERRVRYVVNEHDEDGWMSVSVERISGGEGWFVAEIAMAMPRSIC